MQESASRDAWFSFDLEDPILDAYRSAFGIASAPDAWADLACAIARDGGWRAFPQTVLVLRPERRPGLAVWTDRAAEPWLRAQAASLRVSCSHLRFVSYSQAETLCLSLADRLAEHLSPAELRAARWTAIPRGGHVVLGLLAAALGIPAERLGPPRPDDDLVVAVDDCALTGARFGEFLDTCPRASRVVFAHLLSSAELRAAIATEVPGAVAVAAADLLERVPLDAAERRRRLSLLGGRRFWLGLYETVCFPWSEPDQLIWVDDHPETAWRIAPERLCLKNRRRPGTEHPTVQVQPRGAGPRRPGDHVVAADLEDELLLGDLEQGESYALDGTAADFWRAVVRHGALDSAAEDLAEIYDAEPSILRADLEAFADALAQKGLLVDDHAAG